MLDALETEETLHRLRQHANGALLLDVIEVTDPAMERVARFLPYTDVVLPNTDEATLLTGCKDPWDRTHVPGCE